jgi:hypothetical protein
MTRCRSCQAPVVWLETNTGERIPVDAETVTEGDELFEPRSGHGSHFATYPDGAKWRKRGKT